MQLGQDDPRSDRETTANRPSRPEESPSGPTPNPPPTSPADEKQESIFDDIEGAGSVGDPPEGQVPQSQKPSYGDEQKATGVERAADVAEKASRRQSSNALIGLIDDAAGEAAVAEEEDEEASKLNREREIFFSAYKFTKQDLGMTPEEVFGRMQDPEENVPDEYDEEILDAILFDGAYRRVCKVGREREITFTLQTISAKGAQNAMRILRRRHAEDKAGSDHSFNAMVVAKVLKSLRGKDLSEQLEPSDREGFNSEREIEARLDFCLGLPVDLLDAIGNRANMFTNRTSAALMRNLEDF